MRDTILFKYFVFLSVFDSTIKFDEIIRYLLFPLIIFLCLLIFRKFIIMIINADKIIYYSNIKNYYSIYRQRLVIKGGYQYMCKFQNSFNTYSWSIINIIRNQQWLKFSENNPRKKNIFLYNDQERGNMSVSRFQKINRAA